MFMIFYRINDPKSDGAAAIGGFFLIRRTVLDRAGGYEALKDEVTEDMAIASKRPEVSVIYALTAPLGLGPDIRDVV